MYTHVHIPFRSPSRLRFSESQTQHTTPNTENPTMHPQHTTEAHLTTPSPSSPPRPKLHGPGRPRALDDGKRREICALIAGGCSLRDAAQYVNCSVNTIRREAERNPAFQEQIRHSEQHARLSPLRAMQQAMGTHWRAAAWFLERAFPDRFHRPEPSAIGLRELRALMKEVIGVVNEQISCSPLSIILTEGISDAFDRRLRKANGRRQTARSFRASMKALEAEPDRADPVVDLDALMQGPQSHDDVAAANETSPEFDQLLTAESPFVRQTEPVRHLTDLNGATAEPMQPVPDTLNERGEPSASNAPQTQPDFNIQ